MTGALSWIFVAYDVHLADRVRSILKEAGEFSEKRMFGGLAFMLNGYMCCGFSKRTWYYGSRPNKPAQHFANLIPDQWTSLASR